jgi:hypothetical protein
MYLLPTVQVTPRGVWGQTGPSAFTTLERWIGRSPVAGPEPDEMVARYLRAFGPATPADAQTWSGVPGMREVFERHRPSLRTFRDERGRELFDVRGAPLPDPDAPAPVRFLPEYDNVLLGHADRSRIVSTGVAPWAEVGWGCVLLDGFGAARWKADGDGAEAGLRIEPFRELARADRRAIAEEGARLLSFLAPGADRRNVSVSPG